MVFLNLHCLVLLDFVVIFVNDHLREDQWRLKINYKLKNDIAANALRGNRDVKNVGFHNFKVSFIFSINTFSQCYFYINLK